jgi:hypothetical protein
MNNGKMAERWRIRYITRGHPKGLEIELHSLLSEMLLKLLYGGKK